MAPLKQMRLGPVFAFLAACTACPAAWAGTAEAAEISQQQVEAAYLYKFGGYVTWPDKAFAGPDSPIVIGVAGSDSVADNLTAMVTGRTIGNRPVTVKRIHEGDPLGGIHILFIGSPRSAQSSELFESSRGRPILVVSEGKEGLALGGAVSFVVIDERVRFDVSLDAVQENGLKLSSQLLSVAHAVDGAGQ
ncbi:MAG TPA: YfiR family protein [Gammaproteobacteria bacterium]|nr:YfiR family protein [Gammaproteobacteria bacterium]